jgi:hypothetical protein
LTQPLSFIPPSWNDALRPSTVLQGGRAAAYANARQQIVPPLLSQGQQMNALLAEIRQEAASRAAAGQRGARAGNAVTHERCASARQGRECANRRSAVMVRDEFGKALRELVAFAATEGLSKRQIVDVLNVQVERLWWDMSAADRLTSGRAPKGFLQRLFGGDR